MTPHTDCQNRSSKLVCVLQRLQKRLRQLGIDQIAKSFGSPAGLHQTVNRPEHQFQRYGPPDQFRFCERQGTILVKAVFTKTHCDRVHSPEMLSSIAEEDNHFSSSVYREIHRVQLGRRLAPAETSRHTVIREFNTSSPPALMNSPKTFGFV